MYTTSNEQFSQSLAGGSVANGNCGSMKVLIDERGNLHGLDRLETRIGRGNDNEVVTQQSIVSRKHARILCLAGAYYLEDLGSTHGTFLNSVRIENLTLLNAGDVIIVGATMFTFAVQMSAQQPVDQAADFDETCPPVGACNMSVNSFVQAASAFVLGALTVAQQAFSG